MSAYPWLLFLHVLAARRLRRVVLVGRLDLVTLVVVVWDMAVKPGLQAHRADRRRLQGEPGCVLVSG